MRHNVQFTRTARRGEWARFSLPTGEILTGRVETSDARLAYVVVPNPGRSPSRYAIAHAEITVVPPPAWAAMLARLSR